MTIPQYFVPFFVAPVVCVALIAAPTLLYGVALRMLPLLEKVLR